MRGLVLIVLAAGCAQNESPVASSFDEFAPTSFDVPLAPPANGLIAEGNADVLPGVYFYGNKRIAMRSDGESVCEVHWEAIAIDVYNDCAQCDWAFEIQMLNPIIPPPPAGTQVNCDALQIPSSMYNYTAGIGYNDSTGRMYKRSAAGEWRSYSSQARSITAGTFEYFEFAGPPF